MLSYEKNQNYISDTPDTYKTFKRSPSHNGEITLRKFLETKYNQRCVNMDTS